MNKKFKGNVINIGSNIEHEISYYVKEISKFMSYSGKLIFDTKQPSGTPRKKLNITKATKLGWKSKISFKVGLEKTYESFKKGQIRK